ncbi:hypothetical protein SDC9_119687 [bioreactor metagenome]|jgi:D-ribose pyranose/furanose isomerase RbsD|uniref:D-ribose pyranase n=1 Tax=bioreactor metagenome TaxID=1076179 RepID=A0A645C6U5_9ZZZZ|nr:hypothetical protein [Eubacteriales bacterium]MDD4589878.1 hypothetical protein [Parabacteroides sp.]MEA5043815.1 hypothetical protein [Petrimonas sp.]
MKSNHLSYLLAVVFYFLFACFSSMSQDWKKEFNEELSLLGHRNWIVITDMAYPLQNKSGIKTIYTGESYMDVLSFIDYEIKKSSHINPVIYQDQELSFLEDSDVMGIEDLKKEIAELFEKKRINYLPHDKLIARMNEVSQMFTVFILKTNMTFPYVSTFIELDCGYWSEEQENNLLSKMNKRNE